MYRTCSEATKAKIANIKLPSQSPGWLRAAVSNVRNGSPMSEKQELRMIEALGMASPKRQPRRFYRPCLPVELGEIMREYGWSPEVILWQWVKTYREQETP